MRLLCLACRETIDTTNEKTLAAGCPVCGDMGIPADLDDTVTFTITTHELRIMTIWASNYANQINDRCVETNPQYAPPKKVVQGILDEIAKNTSVPLSMEQEFRDMKNAFPNAEVKIIDDQGREVDL